MSKPIRVFLSLLIVLIVSPYVFVSNTKTIQSAEKITVPVNSLVRGMCDTSKWMEWWPGTRNANGSLHYYKVDISNLRPQVFSVKFSEGKFPDTVEGSFEFGSLGLDSSTISYKLTYTNKAYDPVSKWMHYLKYYRHHTMMSRILQKASVYYSNTLNIYGISIIPGYVKDSSLISTKKIYPDTPSNSAVYDLINKLRIHIKKYDGIITDSAMLNITRLNEHEVQAMVAFPLIRDIPGSNDVVVKKMILGKLLQADVNGGTESIEKARTSLKHFLEDYQMSSPAIPFETLLTNRLEEEDHSKWKTRLNYPVF
jgi:hypothetical protein